MISLTHYLTVCAVLFCVGIASLVVRKNASSFVFGVSVIIFASALAVLSFSRWNLMPEGKAVVMFLLVLMVSIAAVFSAMGFLVKSEEE